MKRIRYELSYYFLDWGLRMIPDPWVRMRFEQAVTIAGETVAWEAQQVMEGAEDGTERSVFKSGRSETLH